MRLKKLILHGFKSFADRTEFVFDSPITGIVGPNGCGKSNVVDGFKWVLGEQSAKSLRGDAMLDVIFNGSAGRKPSGVAEVTLVFDNPRRGDGSRMLHLDVDEVSVGRRLYRDGTSEYQLNNHTSRLKDVRELFFDTGIGVDAYSVIEQGRVAALLEANPEERRLIFEEAAGISKFKQRKKEAQRKLEKVDQNLLRVNDIVEEVEKRLRSVKVQAGRARTYQEHSQRLAELRLTYALHDYHTQHTKLVELEAQVEDARFRLDDASADLAARQNKLAGKREQLEGHTQARQRVEHELVQARAAMQSAKQRQQYAEQQFRQIAEQIEAFEQDRAGVEQKLAEVTESLGAETESLQRLTGELEEQRRLIDERQRAFRDGQLRLNALNQQIEQHKAAVLDLMRRHSLLNSRIGAIEIERKNIGAQQSRLAERRRAVLSEVQALEDQRQEAERKLEAALAAIDQQQHRLDQTREQAASLGKQIALVGEQLGAAREHRSGLLSRQKLLKDLEARREGVSEGVKSVLRQRDLGQPFAFVRGLVADVLRVDVEHAHVIEAALDGRDQWLVAEDSSAVAAAVEVFEDLEGRVNVLCTDVMGESGMGENDTGVPPVPAAYERQIIWQSENDQHGRDARVTDESPAYYNWNQHPQRIRLAVDLVRFEPGDAPLAHHLLGSTVVVDDLNDAMDLHNTGPDGYRYVTRGGEVLEPDGTLRAGPLTASMSILSRRSELEALHQQICEVDARIEQLTAQLAENNTAARALQEQEAALRNDIYRANTAKVELTSQVAQNQDKQGSLRREQPVLDRELEELLEQVGKLKSEEVALAEQRQKVEAEQARRQYLADEAAAEQNRLSEELRQTGEQLTAARVQLGQVQEKQLAGQQQVQRLTAAKGELGQQIDRLARAAEAVAGKRGGVEEELDQARSAEAALLEKQRVLGEQFQQVSANAKAAGEAAQAMTGQVEALRARHAEVEQELHAVQLRLGEVRVRLETLVQRTMDELQLDLPAEYEALGADGGAGYQPAETEWEAVAEEIKSLRDKIHRLGNVNLDAIGEQDELEQRSTFMANQLGDLRESKRQLEELIDTINTESSARFEQTFNAVREHFQGMFRKLFGGGKADIYLETELEEKPSEVRGQRSGPEGASAPSSLNSDLQPLTSSRKVDVLDAGIEIIARPPGKQPVSISQLSGGEKTMTCVALLMSIFKSKPSPFCILDEVDAALDEANNQRFNGIVQEFLEQSQFIVITHSKRTMQIADVLYGVTMQEQGVSKKVAVKFDQVDAQGRLTEQAAA